MLDVFLRLSLVFGDGSAIKGLQILSFSLPLFMSLSGPAGHYQAGLCVIQRMHLPDLK
jgi:hypothetical protein